MRSDSTQFHFKMAQAQPDIDEALTRFIQNPRALRATLRSTQSVISGSFAAQFLTGTHWPDSDLDIYVPAGPNEAIIEAHLTSIQNYDWCNTNSPGRYSNMRGVVTVKSFYGPPYHDASRGSTMIQLVALSKSPVESMLESYYATHILNFITGDAAYCLFPEQTRAMKTVLTRDPGMYVDILERKYGHRGVERVDDKVLIGKQGESKRWVGDELTWKIRFDDAASGGAKDSHRIDDGVYGLRFTIEQGEPRYDKCGWAQIQVVP